MRGFGKLIVMNAGQVGTDQMRVFPFRMRTFSLLVTSKNWQISLTYDRAMVQQSSFLMRQARQAKGYCQFGCSARCRKQSVSPWQFGSGLVQPQAKYDRQLGHRLLPSQACSPLASLSRTSDGVGLHDTLVVWDWPGGCRHNSFSDGVSSVNEQVLGEVETSVKNEPPHVGRHLKHQLINIKIQPFPATAYNFIMSLSETAIPDREPDSLEHVSLRELKLRNKETDSAIQAVQARINYMKTKEQRTVKKVINVKRKLNSLQNVKHKAKEQKQATMEKRKQEEGQMKEAQFNKLIKDHLRYNKKIVMTLMNHKIEEDSKSFKDKLSQLAILNQVQKDNMKQENAEKANRVRMEHLQAHEKRKLYFLDKLQQFKQFKEHKLKEEMRERERQESMISDLEEKERILLERLSVSEKFRLKCQEQYEEAKKKYHSFYQASRGLDRSNTRGHSAEAYDDGEGKADIFIS